MVSSVGILGGPRTIPQADTTDALVLMSKASRGFENQVNLQAVVQTLPYLLISTIGPGPPREAGVVCTT